MSTVSRNCRECAQRLRGGCENTTAPPGSRLQIPWVLRPKRGLPQFTHKLQRDLRCWRPGPGALACRPTWIGESLSRGPKPLRFLYATARFPASPRGKAGVCGPASCRTSSPHFLASWRDAGRETYPPHLSPACPMPP